MNIILFDYPEYRDNLKPITLTRPIGDIRLGILTIAEKWAKRLNAIVSYLTENYLQDKFKCNYSSDNIYINASFLPDENWCSEIQKLSLESGLKIGDDIIAYRTSSQLTWGFGDLDNCQQYKNEVASLKELPHLYLLNGSQIKSDFEVQTAHLSSEVLADPFTNVYQKEKVFIGKNVNIKSAIINAEAGPVYIADHAVIQEGSIIIGPCAILEHGMVAFGAKIRMNTTIGPHCRVGGEVSNSIFQEFSNKAHDGFLGNSFIGAWCNLGANTNNSNLKNNYSTVKLYSYRLKDFYKSSEIFCGTFMGDYTKASISTMLNTGSVIGASVNLFGADFHSKYVPSFSWGGNEKGYVPYNFDKAIVTIDATMSRKGVQLTLEEKEILKFIQEQE